MNKTVMIGVVAGAVGVAGVGGGATYYLKNAGPSEAERKVAAEIAERERFAREEEIHYAVVFSTIRRDGPGSLSAPVTVTFNLAGSRGFATFCAQVPLVEEAVLRTLSRDGLDGPLRDAVNAVLPDRPVRGAQARIVTDPAAGGAAAQDTANKCRKALKS